MKLQQTPNGWVIAGIVLLVLVAGGVIGWQWLMRHFMRQYYESAYQPLPLTAETLGDFPAEHHLPDVPWIATGLPTCQSNSLQMIAAQHGVKRPRRHLDFLMGFTYGASELPGVSFAPFGTDPETGMKTAAPYVGLERRYYVTGDATLYRRALRHFLAQGYPVRVALDMGRLYGVKDFIAHSEVLVGYDAQGFYYYETVCIEPATCDAGDHGPGETGLYVTDETLLAAVHSQSRQLKYPWRYTLTIFEPGETAIDLKPVWEQNSAALLGGNPYGPKTGADAIEAAADPISRRGAKFDDANTAVMVNVAADTRRDNATYLREAFPGDEQLERAARLFDEAALAYQAIHTALADGIADQTEAEEIAAQFRVAANAERAAGEIFAAYGK
ncbi:MAG: hypothetical protein JXA21_20875 [Anaerolineae bacterium]|nr:hypothetical protein [Anaerolineae bacterium]